MSKQSALRFLVVAFVAWSPAMAHGQSAWVPPRGEVNITTTYQWLEADLHLLSDAVLSPDPTPIEILFDEELSTAVPGDITQSHSVLFEGDVALTNRLALTGGVAVVAPRHVCCHPGGEIDDGSFRTYLQDARVGVRYMIDRELWAFTPFVNVLGPASDYDIVGHAAAGRKLKELQLGTSVGRILAFGGAPTAYVEGSYSYAVTENPSVTETGQEIPIDLSRARLELGFFRGRWAAQVQSYWEHAHGGIQWHELDTHGGIYLEHDRAAATREWQLGGGASFATGDATSIYVAYSKVVRGANTHNAGAITVGFNWAVQAFGGLTLGPLAN